MPKPREHKLELMAADLYEQPGHLIRRANQIAAAMYVNIVGSDITSIQYAILRMVHENPGIDQVSLARNIAIDTSTTATTAARLEKKGLLTRVQAEEDRRQLCIRLTSEGERTIIGLVDSVHRMRETVLGSLTQREQKQFMALLRKFVHVNNEHSRAPLAGNIPSANGQGESARAAAARRVKRSTPRLPASHNEAP